MSGLCKVNFPLYCCHCLDNEAVIVAGGGGASKTGVRNAVEVLELSKTNKGCVASTIDQLDTEKDSVMSMSISSLQTDKWRLAASKGNKCSLYELERKSSQPNSNSNGKNKPGLKQRKASNQVADKSRNQGVSSYKFKKIDEFEVVPGEGGLQTCVKLSDDGSLVVSGASDGHVRLWKVQEKKLLFDVSASESEIADIDISSDSKQIVVVSRGGQATLFDVTGTTMLKLQLLLDLHQFPHDKFRNCRFGVVPDNPKRTWIFTSHNPSKPEPKNKSNGCLIKWSKRRSREGMETGDFYPAIIQNTGSEPISTITVSRNGVFLGVGFMEGSIAIYIAFSLQCARRVKSVHSIFVTSLSFLNDTDHVRAITGECDAALVSVAVDCTTHLTKLGSRACNLHGLPWYKSFEIKICCFVWIALLVELHAGLKLLFGLVEYEAMFSLWFVFICLVALAAAAVYLHQTGAL